MKQNLKHLSVRARIAAAPLLLLVAFGTTTGCASKSAELRLSCLESETTFVQNFSKAYISKEAGGGGTEVVLVDEQEATAQAADAIPASSLAGTRASGVRQVMHVKVLWRPQRGTKQSHPSYTNAGMHWYVFNAATGDALEYSGAGFVALTETAGGTQVNIRNATLKPVRSPRRGSLTDPVGPARLTGTFMAKKSPKRVDALLAQVKDAVDGAAIPHASAR